MTRSTCYSRLQHASLTFVLLVTCAAASAAGPEPAAIQVAKADTRTVSDRSDATSRVTANINEALAQDAARLLRSMFDTGSGKDAGTGLLARIQLRPIADITALPGSRAVIPVRHGIAAAAILRTDTVIKDARQLRGQTVCLSSDGNYSGLVAARYGAHEKSFPSLTDALVALRTGHCDAVVHDNTVLQQLAQRDEWKKFAAQLTVGDAKTLAFVLPAADATAAAQLQLVAGDWNARSYPDEMAKRVAASLASDVKRAQAAPDIY